MKTILVPTDFSKCAKNALYVAVQIARKTQAKVHLIHVSEIITQSDVLLEYWSEPELENEYIQNVLESVGKALNKEIKNESYEGVFISTHAEIGHLTNTLKEIAIEKEADLIVMGTEGADGFEEISIGTHTEKIIRTAPCPVLVIANQIEAFHPQKVVFPTTLENDQLVAFKKLRKFQEIFDFEVHLLYLNNPMQFVQAEDAELRKEMLCKEANLQKSSIFRVDALNTQGMIYQFAEEKEADLIVMATHQRRGLLHFLFGSLTEDVVNHTSLPVLSLSLVDEDASTEL